MKTPPLIIPAPTPSASFPSHTPTGTPAAPNQGIFLSTDQNPGIQSHQQAPIATRFGAPALALDSVGQLCQWGLDLFRSHQAHEIRRLHESNPADEQRLIEQAILDFVKNIDLPHDPDWHQYSIEEHTRAVVAIYERFLANNESFPLVIAPEHRAVLNAILAQEIDGVSKKDLLAEVCELHDIGKFVPDLKILTTPQGKKVKIVYDFHEEKSRAMVLNSTSAHHRYLVQKGYTPAQIQYIADCVGIHFEFGHTRNKASKTFSPGGYCQRFLETQDFEATLPKIIADPLKGQLRWEIGLLFLIDNLGKVALIPTDLLDPQTNRSDDPNYPKIREWMGKNLPPELLYLYKMFIQGPVNIRLAQKYFSWLLSQGS